MAAKSSSSSAGGRVPKGGSLALRGKQSVQTRVLNSNVTVLDRACVTRRIQEELLRVLAGCARLRDFRNGGFIGFDQRQGQFRGTSLH